MKRDFDLLVTNLVTNEIDIIRDFSKYAYDDRETSRFVLFNHLESYINNQVPFKVEFNYKSFLGK